MIQKVKKANIEWSFYKNKNFLKEKFIHFLSKWKNKFSDESLQKKVQSEKHHRIYGRPWITGLYQFYICKKIGIKKHNNVLDVGCGAGRLGIHLIKYLNKNKYFGIDSHAEGLYAFENYELLLNDLYLKKPKILLNKNFNFDKFKTKFNFILDFNVSQHLDFSQKKNLIKKINLYLSKNGKYILSPAINLDYKLLKLNNLQIKSIKQTKIIKNIYSTKFSFCVIKKIKN